MTSSRDTPATTATPPAADSHTRPLLDTAWHEQIEFEVEAAFHEGYRQALLDIATRAVELDAAWRPVARRALEQRVAARVREMETLAAGWAGSTWRGRYPGGPVDWETGRPAQTTTSTAPRQHVREAA